MKFYQYRPVIVYTVFKAEARVKDMVSPPASVRLNDAISARGWLSLHYLHGQQLYCARVVDI